MCSVIFSNNGECEGSGAAYKNEQPFSSNIDKKIRIKIK